MRKTLLALLIVMLSTFASPVAAQASGPIYIVQSGDTLSSIAERFNITVAQLMEANNISDPNLLATGQELVIPGLEGITGILDTKIVGFGDNLRGLTRATQVPLSLLKRLNHIVSPSELYVGVSLIVPQSDNSIQYTAHATTRNGESMLELAVRQNTDVWTLATVNDLSAPWAGLPGDTLYYPGTSTASAPGGFPSGILSAEVKTLPLKQGGTAQVIAKVEDGATLTGILVDQPLHFFPLGDGRQVALQGVYVQLPRGIYPLQLDVSLPDGSSQSYEQMVLVTRGDQPIDVQLVPAIDPNLLVSENQKIVPIISAATPTKFWQGEFILPVGLPYCIKDWFGTPRYFNFNGTNFDYFHGGVDYGVCSPDHPLDIYAAATGTVVFTGFLELHGNTTIVDNGWGVYTIYAHQKDIFVSVGQQIESGQMIGQIGMTGHVTGPHLHWEMWVNGIQVDPLDWLNVLIPG